MAHCFCLCCGCPCPLFQLPLPCLCHLYQYFTTYSGSVLLIFRGNASDTIPLTVSALSQPIFALTRKTFLLYLFLVLYLFLISIPSSLAVHIKLIVCSPFSCQLFLLSFISLSFYYTNFGSSCFVGYTIFVTFVFCL